MMLAVLAADDGDIREITEALTRDGLDTTLLFAGVTDMRLDLLVPSPDVVVVKVSPSKFDAASAIRRTRRGLPEARIVVISPAAARRAWLRYVDAGADGIVFSDDAARKLGPVVRCVRVGHMAVPDAARNIVSPPALSYREREVLELAAQGLTNSQIGARLFLAESTVKTHLSSAFRRLGVSSRREAAAVLHFPDNNIRTRVLPAPPQSIAGTVTAIGADGYRSSTTGG